jgi:CubicO group peptidase (beta-lactamase class C family)
MVVDKASKMSYAQYVAKDVAGPLGVSDVEISPTAGWSREGVDARQQYVNTRQYVYGSDPKMRAPSAHRFVEFDPHRYGPPR